MQKTVRALIEGMCRNGGAYTNDGGNGCGGPGYLSEDELRDMLESDDLADYTLVDETPDGDASEVIDRTLRAHRHDMTDGTQWLLAMRIVGDGQANPYRSYLLLWDAEA